MNNEHLNLHFMLESYWQAGSGRGGGALLDALAHKDAAGLPYLPGRTVKGLLRDTVYRLECWEHLPRDTTRRLFGSIGAVQGIPRSDTEAGALAFNNACLPRDEQAWLAAPENQELRRELFRYLSSTAVEKSGAARKGSLRSIEVSVPVTLETRVEVIKAESLQNNGAALPWKDYLQQALPLIRAVGVQRSRGLGRVKVRTAA